VEPVSSSGGTRGRPGDPVACNPLAGELVNELRRRRVLISAAGPAANVLKIRPPLPFGRAEADLFLETLEASLAHLQA